MEILAWSVLTNLSWLPEWLKSRKESLDNLTRKTEALTSLAEDTLEKLKNIEEITPTKKRKREVDTWLCNVERKKQDVRDLEQKMSKANRFERQRMGGAIEKNLQEVEELRERGQFPDGLTLDVHQTRNEALVAPTLFGLNSDLEKVMEWLRDSNVSRIGVCGPKGSGKTALLTHIHNRLVESSEPSFENVYWVTVPEQTSAEKLQDVIARQLGLNMSEVEDKRIRAAKLHNALARRRNSVLILDGIETAFTDELGIPDLDQPCGCKLVLSTRLKSDCWMTDCHEALEIKPLSETDSMALFTAKLLRRRSLSLAAISENNIDLKGIVKRCGGLPLEIINVANRLKALEDISQWRNALAPDQNGEELQISEASNAYAGEVKLRMNIVVISPEIFQESRSPWTLWY